MKILSKVKATILLSLILLVTAPGIILFSCTEEAVEAATKVKLSKAKATVYIGSTYKLKITGTEDTVKWSSSDKKIAKVSSSGKVTGIAKGTATITATVGKNKYTCKVTVKGRLSVDKKRFQISDRKQEQYATFTIKKSKENDTVVFDNFNPDVIGCYWSDFDGDTVQLNFVPLKGGVAFVHVNLNDSKEDALVLFIDCTAESIDNHLTSLDYLGGYARLLLPHTLYNPDSFVINNMYYTDGNNDGTVDSDDTVKPDSAVVSDITVDSDAPLNIIYDISAETTSGDIVNLYVIFYFSEEPVKDQPYLYDRERKVYVNYQLSVEPPANLNEDNSLASGYYDVLANYFIDQDEYTITE